MSIYHPLIFSILFLLNITVFAASMFEPIPLHVKVNQRKADLGKKLFQDTLLSIDNTISCESCHLLINYGVDSSTVSTGIKGRQGRRNSPTVYNSRYNFVQFWDGKVKTLKEQVIGPIQNHVEMNESMQNIIKKLNSDKKYRQLFADIYGEISADTITDAIAEFEKSLITPNSKFDKYLRGDKNALSKSELKGFELFNSKGCVACHNGINIGANLYQKIGYFADLSDEKRDLGRYLITKKEEDKDFFKVPSLRNIAQTAPYFHDGSVATLHEAVRTMVAYQLGKIMSDEEIDSIVLFLNTLTGEIKNEK